MDTETKKEMITFLATLSDFNISMFPTKKTIDAVMKTIYDKEQDIILESLYELRYYLLVNEISDDDLKEISKVNNPISESKLFLDNLKDSMKPVEDYNDDVFFALLYTVRININSVLAIIRSHND